MSLHLRTVPRDVLIIRVDLFPAHAPKPNPAVIGIIDANAQGRYEM